MKILLVAVNAKYIHSNPAIYDLRAYCQKYKKQIELAEYTINHYVEDILIDIYKKKPDFIGLSCYIWNVNMIKELGADLRKILPEVPIWLGGPEVSYESKAFLEEQVWANGIMTGEGEKTFEELLECMVDKTKTLQQISGIVYRQRDGKIQENPWRETIDLSQVPFAYDDIALFEHKIIYYETSRGCPFSCSYCLSSVDKKVRFRDFELVKKELDIFLRHNVPQVKFVDRTFNCNKKHAWNIWNYIMENDNGVTNFHFEIAADLLGEEELDLLSRMRPGLVQLEIGVQSANLRTIEEIKRKMDLNVLEKVTARIRKGRNIHQHLDLIAGLPYEDYESFRKSFNRVYKMEPDQLQLGFLKVLKGSYMYEHAEEYGIQYRSYAPYEVLATNWLSFEELTELKGVEKMVEMYYNSGQFGHTLKYAVGEDAFSFYLELYKEYQQHSLNMQSHSRMTTYEIMLDFLMKCYRDKQTKAGNKIVNEQVAGPGADVSIRELLTLDLYARENVKNRPIWAKDLMPYKDKIRRFYKKEEEKREYLKEYTGFDSRQLSRMTHIDVFTGTDGKERVILFDYEKRNPLNREARMVEVTW